MRGYCTARETVTMVIKLDEGIILLGRPLTCPGKIFVTRTNADVRPVCGI